MVISEQSLTSVIIILLLITVSSQIITLVLLAMIMDALLSTIATSSSFLSAPPEKHLLSTATIPTMTAVMMTVLISTQWHVLHLIHQSIRCD